MKTRARRTRCRQELGVTSTEYVLLAALIAAVIIVAVTSFGQNLGTTYSSVTATMPM